MELHNLKPAAGSTKSKKRIARGQGSGTGGTSTRGHKGAKSRSGWSKKRNFEGGQMPIQMRLPKRGFKNHNRDPYTVFNIDRLEAIQAKYGMSEISPDSLREHRIIGRNAKIKVLGSGDISYAIKVTAHACSAGAKESIESKGGSITIL